MNSILTRQFNLRACQDWPFANPGESLISPVSLFFFPPSTFTPFSLSPPAPSLAFPSLLFFCWQRVYWSKRDGERRSVCVRAHGGGRVGAGMCKKCQSKTFTWKAVSSWKASCFTICLYIFFFLTLSLRLSLSLHLFYCRGPCLANWCESRGDPHTSTADWEVLLTLIEAYMTLIQRDLYTTFCFTWGWPWRNVFQRIYVSAIISALLQLVFFLPSFSHLSFFSRFCMHPLTLFFFFSFFLMLFLSLLHSRG